MSSEHRIEDINLTSGVASKAAAGVRPTADGEGAYKLTLSDGITEELLNIVGNSNFFPIEKGSTITNTDDSAVAADLLQFIYWW